MNPRRFWWLLTLGLALRLPGLFVNGMSDDFEFVLDWGADVRELGLGRGLSFNYGSISFALFGVAAWLAEVVPRFWWLPFKVFAIALELGLLAALLKLSAPTVRTFVCVGYWLNPWFIWHGAYQGFWEGPHLLFGALACLVLVRRDADDRAWAFAGALLCLSWQSKPQGLYHFAVPLGLLLAFHWWHGRRRPLLFYCAGFAAAVIGITAVLWATGGPLLALWHNFRSGNDLYLSHGGPGLWRFVYFVYMQIKGVSGEVYSYRPPIVWAAITTGGALAFSLLLMAWLLRPLAVAGKLPRPIGTHAYLAILIGTLVMSQFAPRAHINHSYSALVLLLPLIADTGRLKRAWGVMVAVLAYAHVAQYKMGAGLLPADNILRRYGHADRLATAMRAEPGYVSGDFWSRLQTSVNGVLGYLPANELISVLSLLVFGAAIVMTIELYRMAQTGDVPGLRTTP